LYLLQANVSKASLDAQAPTLYSAVVAEALESVACEMRAGLPGGRCFWLFRNERDAQEVQERLSAGFLAQHLPLPRFKITVIKRYIPGATPGTGWAWPFFLADGSLRPGASWQNLLSGRQVACLQNALETP
jgi:hypothetical protein